eukprot:768668-Hanusia_phi.AAC.4
MGVGGISICFARAPSLSLYRSGGLMAGEEVGEEERGGGEGKRGMEGVRERQGKRKREKGAGRSG